MGVAVAEEFKHGAAAVLRRIRVAHEPDLAGATLHFVRFASRRVRQRRELAAELDNIAIPVIPAVENFEVAQNLVDRHAWPVQSYLRKDIGTKRRPAQWPQGR